MGKQYISVAPPICFRAGKRKVAGSLPSSRPGAAAMVATYSPSLDCDRMLEHGLSSTQFHWATVNLDFLFASPQQNSRDTERIALALPSQAAVKLQIAALLLMKNLELVLEKTAYKL